MLKREIKFKTLEGEPITKEYFFNLSIDEIADLQFSRGEGFAEHLQRIVRERDAGALLKAYREIIEKSVGVPDTDGISFLKRDPRGYSYGELFNGSNAYTVLFLELMGPESADDAFTNFVKAVVPAELVDQMPETVDLPTGEKTLTREDLLAMSQEEFDAKFGTDPLKMDKAVLGVAFERRSIGRSGG